MNKNPTRMSRKNPPRPTHISNAPPPAEGTFGLCYRMRIIIFSIFLDIPVKSLLLGGDLEVGYWCFNDFTY